MYNMRVTIMYSNLKSRSDGRNQRRRGTRRNYGFPRCYISGSEYFCREIVTFSTARRNFGIYHERISAFQSVCYYTSTICGGFSGIARLSRYRLACEGWTTRDHETRLLRSSLHCCLLPRPLIGEIPHWASLQPAAAAIRRVTGVL